MASWFSAVRSEMLLRIVSAIAYYSFGVAAIKVTAGCIACIGRKLGAYRGVS
jgi:hypothetical protein